MLISVDRGKCSRTMYVPETIPRPAGGVLSGETCPHCYDEWVAAAPKGDEHIKAVQSIMKGTKLEWFCYSRGKWLKGVALEMYDNNVWKIASKDDPKVDLSRWHLPHFWIRNIHHAPMQAVKKTQFNVVGAAISPVRTQKRSRSTAFNEVEHPRLRRLSAPGTDPCPVSYCDNNRGKGYRRLIVHIESQHKNELTTDGPEKVAIVRSLQKLDRVLCSKCHRIKALANEAGICRTCIKQKQSKVREGIREGDESSEEIITLIRSIEQANKTRMNVLTHIPKDLCRKWSQVVTSVLLDWNRAKTTLEALRAVHKWHKLKAVIVMPVRGGKRRRTGGFRMWNNTNGWLACWKLERVLG